jgi:hypothetical protein
MYISLLNRTLSLSLHNRSIRLVGGIYRKGKRAKPKSSDPPQDTLCLHLHGEYHVAVQALVLNSTPAQRSESKL